MTKDDFIAIVSIVLAIGITCTCVDALTIMTAKMTAPHRWATIGIDITRPPQAHSAKCLTGNGPFGYERFEQLRRSRCWESI